MNILSVQNLIIHFGCLRYLSENKIDALPDKIFKGVKSLKAL